MANQFISSWNELYSCQTESTGEALTASIGGITTGIVLEVPNTAQGMSDGAYSEDGITWIQCLASPFDSRPIVFQSPVILRGETLQVVNIPDSNHGVYRFQIGDPTRR